MDDHSAQTPIAFGHAARHLWDLEPDLTFLNHGSFGAIPRELREAADDHRRLIERNPVEGVWRHAIPAIRTNATQVARFIGSVPERTGFVSNATAGVNAVLASLPLSKGDEVLHIDQGYNAVWQAIVRTGRERGIEPRRIELPWPVTTDQEILERFDAGIGPRTRLVVVDQMTSPTAIRLPIMPIIQLAKDRGVEVLVDGAHAPGMFDRPAACCTDAAAWTGNLHKWPCALRGTAAITVRADLADVLKPSITSHFLDQSFSAEFDWQGTFDPTPWLLAGQAIGFMDRFGGWSAVRARNHALTMEAHRDLCEALGVEPMSPLDGRFLGSMATIAFPEGLQPQHGGPAMVEAHRATDERGRLRIGVDPIQRRLLDDHRIEVPVVQHQGRRYFRISAHVYNEPNDYHRLGEAVQEIARAR